MFYVCKIGFCGESVAFGSVTGGAGKDKVPEFVVFYEGPGNAVVYGNGGCFLL